MLPTHRATRARAINEKVKAADAVLKQCNGQTQLAPRAKSKFPNSSKLEAFANTATRVYRVHKFPPGGVHKAVVTLCGSGFFLCRGREIRGGLPGWGNKTLSHRAALTFPNELGKYAQF